MHPRAYFLVVACNIINDKSGWLYFIFMLHVVAFEIDA